MTATHQTLQGEWWDLAACIAYGEHPGDDHQMHRLLEANYSFLDLKQLAAGLVLAVPDLPARRRVPLVPWTEVIL